MSLIRHDRETQRKFVERTLKEEGRVAAYDVLYDTVYADGRKASITRLAAIIHTLRHEGWPIETEGEEGHVAVYVMRQSQLAWRCTVCGGAPQHDPYALLGGLGEAYCMACRGRRTFQKRAAA